MHQQTIKAKNEEEKTKGEIFSLKHWKKIRMQKNQTRYMSIESPLRNIHMYAKTQNNTSELQLPEQSSS